MVKSQERTEELGVLLTEREVLESMSTDALVDFILEKGSKVSEIERIMNLASEVLDGYGTSVEQELDKRKQKSGEEN